MTSTLWTTKLRADTAAIFADATAGADNPWVQIDLGEDKTIGDVDVYGNLETQQTPFSCMIAMLGSADYHAAVDEVKETGVVVTSAVDAVRPWACSSGL